MNAVEELCFTVAHPIIARTESNFGKRKSQRTVVYAENLKSRKVFQR